MFIPLISGSFYKITNAQSVQINGTDGEQHFQTQNRNNSTVENNAYKDITLSHLIRMKTFKNGVKISLS